MMITPRRVLYVVGVSCGFSNYEYWLDVWEPFGSKYSHELKELAELTGRRILYRIVVHSK